MAYQLPCYRWGPANLAQHTRARGTLLLRQAAPRLGATAVPPRFVAMHPSHSFMQSVAVHNSNIWEPIQVRNWVA